MKIRVKTKKLLKKNNALATSLERAVSMLRTQREIIKALKFALLPHSQKLFQDGYYMAIKPKEATELNP